MTTTYKKIGILGGMGPVATGYFYNLLLKEMQEQYHAVQDTDYPSLVLYSLPLTGFDETGIVDEDLVLQQLEEGIQILEQAQCDFIVIPCNTVHYFIEALRMKTKMPILSIIEETVQVVAQDSPVSVGLLASETTFKEQLYHQACEEDIKIIAPDSGSYQKITALILKVMGGEDHVEAKKAVLEIMKKMEGEVDAYIVGCTELSVVLSENEIDIKIYDPLKILAKATVRYAIVEEQVTPIMI